MLGGGYSASIDAGTASAMAAATRTNRKDGSVRISNDKDGSAQPKKKSVRWGEITEHPAETTSVANSGSHKVAMTESHPNTVTQQQRRKLQQHQQNQQQQQQQQKMNKNSLPKDGEKLLGNSSKCRLPGHSHSWKECPNNPYSRNFCGIDHRTMNFSSHMQQSSLASSGVSLAESTATKRTDTAAAMKVGLTDIAQRFLANVSERQQSSGSVIPQKRKLPPAVLPSSSKKIRSATAAAPGAGAGSANHLFNTTNSARPIPRRTTASIHPVYPPNNPRVPRKNTGMQQSQSKQQHPQSRQQGRAPSQQTTSQSGKQKGVKYANGQWRRVDPILAPAGNDAQALQKHTSSRLLAGAKRKGNDEGGGGEDHRGGDRGNTDEDSISKDSDMIESQKSVAGMNKSKRDGGYGNGGRVMQRAERGEKDGGTYGGEDVSTSSSSSSSCTSRVSANNEDPSHSGDDRPTSAKIYENTNNGFDEVMGKSFVSASEKDGPRKSGLDFTIPSVAGLDEQRIDWIDEGVTSDIDENDADDHENCEDGNSIDTVSAEEYSNRTDSDIADEMEQDLFDLIHMGISLNEQWIKRCEEGHDDDDAGCEEGHDENDAEGFEETMRLQQYPSHSDVAESLAMLSAKAGATSMDQVLHDQEGKGEMRSASPAEGQRAERLSDEGGLEALVFSSSDDQVLRLNPSGSNTASSLSSGLIVDSRKNDPAVTVDTHFQQRQGQHQHLFPSIERSEVDDSTKGGREKLPAVVVTTCELQGVSLIHDHGPRKNYDFHRQRQQNPIINDRSGDGRDDTRMNTSRENGAERHNNEIAMVSLRGVENTTNGTSLPSFTTGVVAPGLDQSQTQLAVQVEQTDFGPPPTKLTTVETPVDTREVLMTNHNIPNHCSDSHQVAAIRSVDNSNKHNNIGNGLVHILPCPMNTVDVRRGDSTPGTIGKTINRGPWTMEEHEAFLLGMQKFGRRWKHVSTIVKTRTPNQIQSHSQNYFKKLSKEDISAPALVATPAIQSEQQLQHEVPLATGQFPSNLSSSHSSEMSPGLLNISKVNFVRDGGGLFGGFDKKMVDDVETNHLMNKIDVPTMMPANSPPSHLNEMACSGRGGLNHDKLSKVDKSCRKPSKEDYNDGNNVDDEDEEDDDYEEDDDDDNDDDDADSDEDSYEDYDENCDDDVNDDCEKDGDNDNGDVNDECDGDYDQDEFCGGNEISTMVPGISSLSHPKKMKGNGWDGLHQESSGSVNKNTLSGELRNDYIKDDFFDGEENRFVGVRTDNYHGPTTLPLQISSRWNNCNLDDGIPAFLTCNKCNMVFADNDEAHEHEKDCTIITNDGDKDLSTQEGRAFYDEKTLLEHIIADYLRTRKVINEDNRIFFRPSSRHYKERSGRLPGVEEKCSSGVSLLADDLNGEIDGDKNIDTDCHEVGFDDARRESDEEATEMILVKHLCSTTVDQATGLPTQKLTVLCGDSETLYDFKVDIKSSSICNAGYGAYLTYLGARVLKKNAANRSTRLIQKHIAADDVGTLKPLTAQTLGGRMMSVKVTGENLHCNDNNIYWTKKRFKKYFLSDKSYDESKIGCKIHREVKQLRDKIPDGQGIGFLGIHSESDYISDDRRPFWSFPNGMFHLGRYGPHRPEDRKKLLHFDFKNFIHNYEPMEWSYDVPELLQNHTQMIDITDDATGKVHALARSHTPTYVNEVGHNPHLHTNVVIRDKDDRTVHYYVAIDQKHAMMKGDSVELLVDYGDTYEEVRERKGYGRDITFDPIQRNLEQREDLENNIRCLTEYGMFELVEFLAENIFAPLVSQAGTKNSDLPWERVLVARRRLQWIGEKFDERVQELAESYVNANSKLLFYIRRVTQEWRNERHDHDPSALQDELKEEELYRDRSPSHTKGGLARRERRLCIAPIPDNEFTGWFSVLVPRRSGSSGPRADKYWYHPDLLGVAVRSAKGMRVLTDYMSKAGVGVNKAYEACMGVTKYFQKGYYNS